MNLREKLERLTPPSNPSENRLPRATTDHQSRQCEHFVTVFPHHHKHGSFTLNALHGQFRAVADMLLENPFEDALDFERIAFIDTETTGLSGGIGVCAFLVGVGYLSSDGFVVEQFLMNDFPAEADMLRTVCTKLEGFDVISSYNGRAFDIPILDGRLLLNRMRTKLASKPHIDLLHPARRVWKHRLGDCSLKSLETHVLDLVRTDDIEGWMIPQAFFDYLQTGDKQSMEQILLHNRHDLVSLAAVASFMFRALDSPERAPLAHGAEWYGLATLLEQHRRTNEATHCMERALAMGLPTEIRSRCIRALSLTRKRQGRWKTAAKLWHETTAANNEMNTFFALEELAKFYEHRQQDLVSARAICQRALNMLEVTEAISGPSPPARHIENFEHRLRRIERKIRGKKNA